MELDIRDQSVPHDPELRRLARRRTQAALWRIPLVRRVDLRLADINGPRGGVDQRCRVAVELDQPGPTIVAEATDATMATAIDQALSRAARQIRTSQSKAQRRRQR